MSWLLGSAVPPKTDPKLLIPDRMRKQACRYYTRLREAGYPANHAWHAAKVWVHWDELEAEGLVRLRAEPEEDNYWDVYGEPEGYTDAEGNEITPEQERERIQEMIDTDGCWVAIAEVYNPNAERGDGWESADSIGMLVGYKNVLDPIDNWYIPDLMLMAINQAQENEVSLSL